MKIIILNFQVIYKKDTYMVYEDRNFGQRNNLKFSNYIKDKHEY